MNKAIMSACVALALVHFSPAALASQAEFVTEHGPVATFNGQQVRAFFTHNGSEIGALGVEVPAAMYEGAPMDPPSDGKFDGGQRPLGQRACRPRFVANYRRGSE